MGVFSIGKKVIGSLFNKPATLMYPVIPREWEERTRGAVDIDKEKCVLCGMCARSCPTGAIDVNRKTSTWMIQRMNCIQCGACIENCPPSCLIMSQKYTEPGTEKVVDSFEIVLKKKPKKEAAEAAVEAGNKVQVKPETKVSASPAPVSEAAGRKSEETSAAGLQCDQDSCVFCGACAESCPVDAITVDGSAWSVDRDACIQCGACIDQCPADCLKMTEDGGEETAAETAADGKASVETASAEVNEPEKAAVAVDPRIEGYLKDVKDSLIKDQGLSEEESSAVLERSELAEQLKTFPYLMNKEAGETAKRINQ